MANEFLEYYLQTAVDGLAIALYRTARGEIFVRVENQEGDEARYRAPGQRYNVRYGRKCFDCIVDFAVWATDVAHPLAEGVPPNEHVVGKLLEALKDGV